MENELLAFEIEPKLKKNFKIWCIKKETDMKTVLTDHIKEVVK